jgi:hypothetical protein
MLPSCFEANNGTASVVAQGGTPQINGYDFTLWNGFNVSGSQVIMTGQLNPFTSTPTLEPGDYSWKIVDANGCSDTANIYVAEFDEITAALVADFDTLCAGDVATFTVTSTNTPPDPAVSVSILYEVNNSTQYTTSTAFGNSFSFQVPNPPTST